MEEEKDDLQVGETLLYTFSALVNLIFLELLFLRSTLSAGGISRRSERFHTDIKVICEVSLSTFRHALPVEDNKDVDRLRERDETSTQEHPRRHSTQATGCRNEAAYSPALQRSSLAHSLLEDNSSKAIGRQPLHARSVLAKETC